MGCGWRPYKESECIGKKPCGKVAGNREREGQGLAHQELPRVTRSEERVSQGQAPTLCPPPDSPRRNLSH